jgi:hypothetical protein
LAFEGKSIETEYREYDFGRKNQEIEAIRRPMIIISDVIDDVIGKVKNFKYLGSFILKNRGFNMNVKQRIKCS